MVTTCRRFFLILPLLLLTACTSATDRLNEGLELQAQGRFMEAAYRYADAVEKDASLQEARDQLLIIGDSAIIVALEEADHFYDRGEPVAAARRFSTIDRLMSRVRSVGMRLAEPEGYGASRQAAFEQAIDLYMIEGENASMEGRWEDAVRAYAAVRAEFSPTRDQREAAFDAETRVLIDWAEIELGDRRPRAAFVIAERALTIRRSTPRPIVLEVRNLQERAVAMGTVVLAPLPVSSTERVRDVVGADLEIALDETLETGPWREAPPFVVMADSDILRRELRGLLRGRIPQSPALVGRALYLIGADYGVMVEINSITIADVGLEIEEHTAVIERRDVVSSRERERGRRRVCDGPGQGQARGRGVGLESDPCRGRGWGGGQQGGRGSGQEASQGWVMYGVGDTVTYRIISGRRTVRAEAEVLLVNLDGRAAAQFTIAAHEDGPFLVGDFNGDPWQLGLSGRHSRVFELGEWDGEWSRIRRSVIQELAVGITAETFAEVLSRIH